MASCERLLHLCGSSTDKTGSVAASSKVYSGRGYCHKIEHPAQAVANGCRVASHAVCGEMPCRASRQWVSSTEDMRQALIGCCRRNRRESNSLSPLWWVPQSALLLSAVKSIPPKHPHVNPPTPLYKVPRVEWPRIVQRVAQGESLRQVARGNRVPYEAIRRILASARRHQTHSEGNPEE